MNGEMTLGALVAFVEYSRNCTWPMEMLGWLTNDVSSAVASYKKIRKIYAEQPKIKNDEHPKVLDEIRGEICFDHAGFYSWTGRRFCGHQCYRSGRKDARYHGATGSGKSSIVNLLQRFYDVTDGAVKIDGVDVRKMDVHQLRSNIAVVLQDVFPFSDTIEEEHQDGTAQGTSDGGGAPRGRGCQSARFIEKMDEQYETVIGERGVGLSGGQKQRISIARALAKHSPILVLDDSTSALDMETEHEIQQTLNALRDTTKIIIAHRISAVRHADEIIYLADGKIAERGTHEELLAKKGLYYDTYMAQYGALAMSSASAGEPAPAACC